VVGCGGGKEQDERRAVNPDQPVLCEGSGGAEQVVQCVIGGGYERLHVNWSLKTCNEQAAHSMGQYVGHVFQIGGRVGLAAAGSLVHVSAPEFP